MSEIISQLQEQSEVFGISEEHKRFRQEGLNKLEAFSLGSDPDADLVAAFGDEVFKYNEGLREVWPEFSWVYPRSFQGSDIVNFWRNRGLVEPTIFPVVKRLLTFHNLWQEPAIKALVLDHLCDRVIQAIGLRINDLAGFAAHFYEKMPAGDLENGESAVSFVHRVADNAFEMSGKRVINVVPEGIACNKDGEFVDLPSPLYPNLNNVDSDQWRTFCQSTDFGWFSSVLWFEECWEDRERNREKHPKEALEAYGRLCQSALKEVVDSSDFREFTNDPFDVLNRAYGEYLASST